MAALCKAAITTKYQVNLQKSSLKMLPSKQAGPQSPLRWPGLALALPAEALTAAGPLKQARDQLIASGRSEDSIADLGSICVRNASRQSPALHGRLKLGKWRHLVYSQSLQVSKMRLVVALRCSSLGGSHNHLLTVTTISWRLAHVCVWVQAEIAQQRQLVSSASLAMQQLEAQTQADTAEAQASTWKARDAAAAARLAAQSAAREAAAVQAALLAQHEVHCCHVCMVCPDWLSAVLPCSADIYVPAKAALPLQLSSPVQELDAVSREVESVGPAAAVCDAAVAAMAAREQAMAILAAQAEDRLQVRRPGWQTVLRGTLHICLPGVLQQGQLQVQALVLAGEFPDCSLLYCNVSPWAALCVLQQLDCLQDAMRQQHLIQERQAQLPSDTLDLPAAQQQCMSARQEAVRLAEGGQAADAALHEAQQQRAAAVQATQRALDEVSRALVFM